MRKSAQLEGSVNGQFSPDINVIVLPNGTAIGHLYIEGDTPELCVSMNAAPDAMRIDSVRVGGGRTATITTNVFDYADLRTGKQTPAVAEVVLLAAGGDFPRGGLSVKVTEAGSGAVMAQSASADGSGAFLPLTSGFCKITA